MRRAAWCLAALLALDVAVAGACAHAATAAPKRGKPAAPAPALVAAPPPVETISPAQLELAARVYTGAADCEFQQRIDIVAVPGQPGFFHVTLGKTRYLMTPQETTTGAVRLEDRSAGTVWIQIPAKSMLMNAKLGRRLVDACQHAEQRLAMANAPTAGSGIGIVAQARTELKLRILETADVHMQLLNYDYARDLPSDEYGLAKTATLIKAARAENANTLLFDNGDLLQGNALGDQVARVAPLQTGQVHPAYKVLNALAFDAANIGNHEFNDGLPFLRQAIAGAAFPIVSANVFLDDGDADPTNDKNAFTPFVLLEREFTDSAGNKHKLKIGVTGFVPPQVMQWDREQLQGRVTVRDIVDTARVVVPQMKAAGADIVVAMPHSGLGSEAENAVARLAEVPGISAILFGHAHGEFPGPAFAGVPKVDIAKGTVNGIPATMPGRWGSHLGVIDLVLVRDGNTWQVADARAALRPVWNAATRQPLVAADAAVAALVATEHAATLVQMRTEVATSRSPIHSYFARVADDASVQLVSQAQRAWAQRALQGTPFEALPLLSAAAPFKTGGRQGQGDYTDIPAGALALRHVADLYMYPNTVQAVALSGAQVREWLEMAAGAFNRVQPGGAAEQDLLNPDFPGDLFDTIDGVTYRIDVTQPARYSPGGALVAPQARRITDLRFNGQPIDDSARFVVVTNNYRAGGGGNFPGLAGSQVVLKAPIENRQVLAQYLAALKQVDPTADGNWRVLPVPGVKLLFTSGAGAMAHVAGSPQVRLVKDNGDGSALFELLP